MELDYRTVMRIRCQARSTVHETNTALYTWLRGKNLDADRLDLGVTEFNDTTVGTLARVDQRDGTSIERFRLTEVRPGPSGQLPLTWMTEVLTYQHADPHVADVLIHVADPRDNVPGNRPGPTGVPRIVRIFVDATSATDGSMTLHDGPTILDVHDEDLVHEMIVDEGRRNLLVLAATSPGSLIDDFARQVRELTFGTVGQAGTFVLTAELAALLEGHTGYVPLPPGGMRAFPPGIDPASRASASASYFITADRLAERDPHRVERHWTWLAREHGNAAPWPRQLQRVMRTITEHERGNLLADVDAFIAERTRPLQEATVVDPEAPSAAAEIAPVDGGNLEVEVPGVIESSSADLSHTNPPVEPVAVGAAARTEDQLRDALVAALPTSDILATILGLGGCATVTESLQFALLLAGDYDQLQAKVTALTTEMTADSGDSVSLERLLDLEEQVQALQADRDDLENRLDRVTRGAGWLRTQLMEAGRPDIAYAEPDEIPLAQDFDTVLEVVRALPFVRFTGDADKTLDLNEMKGSTSAARRTHSALLALNDYAKAKAEGVWNAGAFADYINDTPVGFAGVGRKAFVPKESDSVHNKPEFRRHRELPMPDGRIVMMEAHIRLSQEATTAPRLHFYDDTASTGVIVVGYIGAHLPNTRTN